MNGYRVSSSGRTISSISQLAPHAGKTRTSYGGSRLIADFTLYKGNEFLNIPVPSPVDGKVNWAGYAGNGGKWVEIESDQGLVELGHFNSLNVQTGDKVTVGSVLGLQGYSGRTVPPGINGTHVHIQAPDSVIQNYISRLASNTNVSGGSVARKESNLISPKPPNAQRISTQERKGSEVVIIDDTKPSSSPSSGDSSGGSSYKPIISEFNMLNNFIKKKLLTDLSFL
jgi:murein DD-endopeptidase MepM/ murein hydrolase activator NlpD